MPVAGSNSARMYEKIGTNICLREATSFIYENGLLALNREFYAFLYYLSTKDNI